MDIFGEISRLFDGLADEYKSDGTLQGGYAMKYAHCKLVAKEAAELAECMEWLPEEVQWARMTGLLHDAGRFEQLKKYGTFYDGASTDHGDLGCEVVRARFAHLMPAPWNEIISTAVKLHNKMDIPGGMDSLTDRFVRIVRDADKIDIYRAFYEHLENGRVHDIIPQLPTENSPPTPEVVQAILNDRRINHNQVQNLSDLLLVQASWVYDINYPAARARVASRGYLCRLRSWVLDAEGVDEIFRQAQEYCKTVGLCPTPRKGTPSPLTPL